VVYWALEGAGRPGWAHLHRQEQDALQIWPGWTGLDERLLDTLVYRGLEDEGTTINYELCGRLHWEE
jgi:hypothetical protein